MTDPCREVAVSGGPTVLVTKSHTYVTLVLEIASFPNLKHAFFQF